MSLDIHVSTGGIRLSLSRYAIAEAARIALHAERVRNAMLSITLLDRAAIARLNKEHLNHSGPTDVISFGFTRATPRDPVVGDIYIAPDVARSNARARRIPVREELARLVVHGTLHVLGHDHPEDESREASGMWRTQERILKRVLARGLR